MVLLPAPAGPSMAMMSLRVEGSVISRRSLCEDHGAKVDSTRPANPFAMTILPGIPSGGRNLLLSAFKARHFPPLCPCHPAPSALCFAPYGMATSEQREQKLQQWVAASVIDAPAADRIRNFESAHDSRGMRWPVVLAIAFGAIMVGAGILLFVAAHWDDLSPTQRFLLVLAMIAGFHLAAGALMPRLRALGIALHGVGTAALGAGIFLAAQIFNLQEHWPGGILLWAIGAVLSWAF